MKRIVNDKRDFTAVIITVCAVITAMPRWIGALLASEGFAVPEDWRPWWIVASTVFNAAMAIVEGVAFAYVFNAWRNQRDKNSDKLLWLTLVSGLVFIIVLAPFIAAQTRASQTPLTAMLANDVALWVWSSAVAASTIVIVASVGYAQKKSPTQTIDSEEVAELERLLAEAQAENEKLEEVIDEGRTDAKRQMHEATKLREELVLLQTQTQAIADWNLLNATAKATWIAQHTNGDRPPASHLAKAIGCAVSTVTRAYEAADKGKSS